ncbi:peptidylprolyl isomerase [Thiolapillus sp.]
MTRQTFKNVLREPLLHFLLIGAGLFFLFGQLNDPGTATAQRIVISEADLEQLAATWLKATGRPPSAQERENQLRQFIRERVLYREAMAMGLDKDDVIVRRRLAKKMEYLFNDLSVVPEPTEDDLSSFLAEHSEKFMQPARISFRQIYLDPSVHGSDLDKAAGQLLQVLQADNASIDPANVGDRSLLPHKFGNETEHDIAGMFGVEFADKLFNFPLARWQGPVASEYGAHLVYIEDRTAAMLPALSAIRKRVTDAWRAMKREAANEVFYQSLYRRYEIVVDGVAAGVKK